VKASVKKTSLSLTFISILLLFSWDIIAKNQQEQSFDDIDRMLDKQFRQKNMEIDSLYNAYTKAIDDAFHRVTKKIEVKWPNNVRLPTKSTWVGYSKNLQTRSIVDYQAGEVVIETLVTNNDLRQAKLKLETMAEQLTAPTTAPIEELDVFTQAINDNLNKKGIQPVIEPLNDKNILKQVLPENKLLKIASADIKKLSLVKEITPLISSVRAKEILPATDNLPTKVSIPTIDTSSVIALKARLSDLKPLTTPAKIAIEIKEPTIKLDLVKTAEGSLLKMTIKFVNNYQKVLLANNFDDVKKFSKKYNVAISVILAIIETESSYNPRAISRVPAFGLMQLVPKTAGIDAHNYVHGQKKILSPDYLFDETNNLQLGTAYFKLLKSRYLRKIENPQSRFYCAVSSYNTGVGNLAKTFTGKKNLSKAAKVINTMTSNEVYQYLLKNLPAEETRNYLKKIVSRRAKYVHFDSEIKEI
jgi:membrane-bound lytic murein transglycosylase C